MPQQNIPRMAGGAVGIGRGREGGLPWASWNKDYLKFLGTTLGYRARGSLLQGV